jgi:hypothetical protein
LSSPFHALEKYLPKDTFHLVDPHLRANKVALTITRPRSTKYGDYRPPRPGQACPHRISVNANLNPYAFLLTLVHEIAHLYTHKAYERRAKPHGPEWKSYFRQLLQPFLNERVFPANVEEALLKSLHDLSASSCTDPVLHLALQSHNAVPVKGVLITQLNQGDQFWYNNRVFRLEGQLRKRYKCTEMATNKPYLFSPIALISPHHG